MPFKQGTSSEGDYWMPIVRLHLVLPALRMALGMLLTGLFAGLCAPRLLVAEGAYRALVTEERAKFLTYPFSRPNRTPILVSDARLYPYHRFEGYSLESLPRDWTVVKLENDWIEVWVLPEVGGKVWGARVKKTGHEFIYCNEVMKFRNIAMRGPWTSGGIEFNFGIMGHTPATSTPVDYATRENDDGSVSVHVGATDLPSRTRWRVEVRLPADHACFETRVRWENPTALEQSYYNWMTAAAFARDDLVLHVPGHAYLGHAGDAHSWPEDEEGRRLDVYAQNRFGANRSYHVVGEFKDSFGGYYVDDDYGFGHWAPYEDMPGQKIWLWALSRQGGIWEDLLTDTDGQYVEFQAGRLLVQYAAGSSLNPITEVGFEPGATDEWVDVWFPLEGLGGLSDGSPDGAFHVERRERELRVRAHAFVKVKDRARVYADGVLIGEEEREFEALRAEEMSFALPADTRHVRVEMPGLGLVYHSDPEALQLARPFTTPQQALTEMPDTMKSLRQASELVERRRLTEARLAFEQVIKQEAWNRDALIGLAELEYQRGLFESGLSLVRRALQLDAYDPQANFVAGILYQELERNIDATEAFGWAARSMAYRAVANLRLAEIALAHEEITSARRHALRSLQYDTRSSGPRRMLALVARVNGDSTEAEEWLQELAELDPLDHFVRAERFLASSSEDVASVEWNRFTSALRGEYPEQEVLELAIDYVRRGRAVDATRLLQAWLREVDHPVLRAWYVVLDGGELVGSVNPEFVFPYRVESLAVLREAVRLSGEDSTWRYLLALNLWARDRVSEAAEILASLGDEPGFAPFYVARAAVGRRLGEGERIRFDIEADLRRAITLDDSDRDLRIPLIQFLQQKGRHEDALIVTEEARVAFPGDFVLDLLRTGSLVKTQRAAEALEILEATQVLPSEHSSQAHSLFEQAHLQAGLSALETGDVTTAESHFREAMTWPEHLGQGKPYTPEERLPRYLLALARARGGDTQGARLDFEAVVAATHPESIQSGSSGRLDLLAVPALEALGRAGEAQALRSSLEEMLGRGQPDPDDMQGCLLYQALKITP